MKNKKNSLITLSLLGVLAATIVLGAGMLWSYSKNYYDDRGYGGRYRSGGNGGHWGRMGGHNGFISENDQGDQGYGGRYRNGWDGEYAERRWGEYDFSMPEKTEKPLSSEVVKSLNTAIQDEYKAIATYQKTIEKFGNIRPFDNIIQAERKHVELLKSIYDRYEIESPMNEWVGKVTVPDTVQEVCAEAVVGEIDNARLYKEDLLPVVKDYPDLEAVFNHLMDASQDRHLLAFKRCS